MKEAQLEKSLQQRREKQLEILCEALGALHPIGSMKAIGYMECVQAFREWLEMQEPSDNILKAIEILKKGESE